MPKMKSNRAAKKRFRVTGTGKIKRKKGYARHILGGKTRARKRHLRKSTLVAGPDERRAKKLLGIG
jgi:large subunit ribosomal protein L35